MIAQPGRDEHSSRPGAPAATPAPPGAGPTTPAVSTEVMQHWVDRAAHFNMFSAPNPLAASPGIFCQDNSGALIGVRINEVLHRFDVATQPASAHAPMRARNILGEPAGKFTHRWLLAPDDFVAGPHREPPPTPLVPSRPQRFVMLDSRCEFGEGEDGFLGFGAGNTVPIVVNGQPQLLATAVGVIIEGFGKFKGHEEGTYVYSGTLDPKRGFMGNVLLRVIDRQETLRTENALPVLEARTSPERDIVYLLFRGQAVPADPVVPKLGPDGRPTGLIVEQGLRRLDLDFKTSGHSGLQSTARVGPIIGKVTAHVTFDLTAPGGTVYDPIPFTSYDEFVFFDQDGNKVGALTANSSEGRVFHTQLAGQPGIRFGGAGRILSGSGALDGINGLMTDNSVVVFDPHVSASIYVLRVYDPLGKFSTGRC